MTTPSRPFGSALLVVFATAALLAQTPAPKPALNVRMGLWETTSTMNIGGDMPGVDMSQMTPEQKAHMQAMMQNMMGAHTTTVKSCLTRQKFDEDTFMTQKDPDMKCEQKITTNTATTLEITETCTGDRPTTMHIHFTAASPTSVQGTVKTTTAATAGHAMNMDGTITSKWLSADCGDVK